MDYVFHGSAFYTEGSNNAGNWGGQPKILKTTIKLSSILISYWQQWVEADAEEKVEPKDVYGGLRGCHIIKVWQNKAVSQEDSWARERSLHISCLSLVSFTVKCLISMKTEGSMTGNANIKPEFLLEGEINRRAKEKLRKQTPEFFTSLKVFCSSYMAALNN